MIFAALLVSAFIQTAVEPKATCAVDQVEMLALPPEKFDGELNGGWRPLAKQAKCRTAAADLIKLYRQAHWGKLDSLRLHESYWHEGQLRAAAGQTKQAVRLMMAGVNADNEADGEADSEDYAEATIAFLNHDLEALKSARERLAKAPKPIGFDEAAKRTKEKYGVAVEWPLNLEVVDKLVRCFKYSYDVAYHDACPGRL